MVEVNFILARFEFVLLSVRPQVLIVVLLALRTENAKRANEVRHQSHNRPHKA